MTAEFSKLWKRLAIASAVAVLMPMGAAVLLGGASAAADRGSESEQAEPAPVKTMSLDTLGRARAVSWISSGHISAP